MMDSDAGSLRNWTASVEDLLAFVDRASKSVTAALKRPSSKPKGRLNLRRYIQKRLNNSQDYVRDRTPAMSKKKKPRTSKFSSSSSLGSNFERSVTPTLQGAESSSQADLICGDFFGSVVPSGNYSWNSNPSLLYGYYNDDSWSASGRTQEGHTGANEANLCDGGNDGGVFRTRDSCQNLSYSSASPDNGGCCMSTSDTPSRQGTNVVCASVVDPVFPPENCDKIVPLITPEPFVAHDTADVACSTIQENSEDSEFQFNSCMLETERKPSEPEFSVPSTSFFSFFSASHSLVSMVSNVE